MVSMYFLELAREMACREVKQPRREFPEGALPRKSATKYDSTGKRVNKPARISSTPSNRFDGQQVRLCHDVPKPFCLACNHA